jgi:hypothetical protein
MLFIMHTAGTFPDYEIYGKAFMTVLSLVGFLAAHLARHGGVVPKKKRN